MRFANFFCIVFFSSLSTGALACDKKSAAVEYSQFVNMGHGEPGTFHWSSNMQSMPDEMRAHLMESYAKVDACLNGASRAIRFYQGDKSFGQVGVDGQFVPADPKYKLPAKPGVHVWMDAHVK